MSDALFLATGVVVKKKGVNSFGKSYELLPTGFNDSFISTIEGKVIAFKILDEKNNPKEFIYRGYEHFLDNDKIGYKSIFLGGFCQNAHYENYKNRDIKLEEFIREENWFDSNFEYAQKYDIVEIERIEFDDSSKYYSQRIYYIGYDPLIDFNNQETYTTNEDTSVDTSRNLLNTNSGRFYSKNIPVVYGDPNIREYTKTITVICFRIDRIYYEILGILSKDNLSYIKEAIIKKYNQNNTTDYDNLFKVDQIIGGLMKDWGYIDELAPAFLLEEKSLMYANNYYNSLVSFYNTLLLAKPDVYFGYDDNDNPLDINKRPITKDGVILPGGEVGHATQAEKDKADDERRIVFLFKYLTTDGIGILDYETRLNIVKQSLKLKSLPQESGELLTQNNLIKIVASFANSADADKFLDFLLEKENGSTINFQNLYYKFDDYIIEIDVPILGFTVGDTDRSRKLFVYAIYSIWRYSKYNPNYIPSGTTPNEEGLNPNSYFLSEGKSYFVNEQNDPITDKSLEFDAVETDQDVFFYDYDVDKNFYDNKIKIIKGVKKGSDPYPANGAKTDLWYHLYQPMLILGYKSVDQTEQLYLPAIPRVPAFMFKYFKEYEDKYKTNAFINFGVQVSADVLLLYFTGGGSQLAEMRYLKYLSESGNILLKPSAYMQATNVVRLWSVVNTAEKVSFVASTLANFATYLSATSGNEEDKKFYEKMRTLAFLVMLGTGVGSLVAQRKAVKLADDLLARLSQPGLTIALSDPAKAFLISIAQTEKYFDSIIGKIDAALDTFAPSGTPNNITPLFSTFTKEEKLGFYFDFIQMDGRQIPILNNADAIAVKNWKKLFNVGAVDRTVIDIITNTTKTNAMERFYNVVSFKKALEARDYVRRWNFLESFKNIDEETFDLLKIDHRFINFWFQHIPDARAKIAINDHTKILLKHRASYSLLKQGNYNEVIAEFGHSLEPSKTVSGFPGARYIATTPDEDLILVAERASNNDDILPIANNLGIPEHVSQGAKENYWVKERLVLYEKSDGTYAFGIGRFYKDEDMVKEWNSIVDGSFSKIAKEEAKSLIAHEYIEGKLIDLYGMNYTSFDKANQGQLWSFGAHDIAPKASINQYWDAGRLNQHFIPLPNYNLTNLDEIVEKIAQFYNLK